MVRSVVERHADIDHRIAGKDTILERFDDPFFHGRPVLLGNDAADDLVDKLETVARIGLYPHDGVGELPFAAGLFGMLVMGLHLLADGFATPTIFVSGLADETTRTQALAAGAVGFLRKPFGQKSLIDCVKTALICPAQ